MTIDSPARIAPHLSTEPDGRGSSVLLVLSGPGGTGRAA